MEAGVFYIGVAVVHGLELAARDTKQSRLKADELVAVRINQCAARGTSIPLPPGVPTSPPSLAVS